jgi:hypothetical protein
MRSITGWPISANVRPSWFTSRSINSNRANIVGNKWSWFSYGTADRRRQSTQTFYRENAHFRIVRTESTWEKNPFLKNLDNSRCSIDRISLFTNFVNVERKSRRFRQTDLKETWCKWITPTEKFFFVLNDPLFRSAIRCWTEQLTLFDSIVASVSLKYWRAE